MSSLESLSPELKLMILDNIFYFEDLKNIIRASPDFHATYLSARDVILSRIIFHGQLDWSNDEGELCKTEALVVVDHMGPGRRVSDEVKTTLRQIRRHELGKERMRTINGEILLNYEQCLNMLTLYEPIWKETTATYIKKKRRGWTKLRYPGYGSRCMQSARQSKPILGFDCDLPDDKKRDFVYLDDVRGGYPRLDVPLYRWYRHLSVFCPRTNKWRDWIASEDHARCVRECYCD